MNAPSDTAALDEKSAIERGTAEGFLALYNRQFGDDYRIVSLGDFPDVRCINSRGNPLNLEITITEDRPGDAKAGLGRSNHRSLEALRAHLDRVARGEERIQFSSLTDEVSDQLLLRVRAKCNNDYGKNCGLVVRDTSGCDWDWEQILPNIRNRLHLHENPFDCGIWLINRTKDRCVQLI